MKPQDEGSSKRLRVAIIGPSLRYVGGQSVQADLLLRLWRDDPEVEAKFIPVDPPLPSVLDWAAKLRGVRTGLREPLYCWDVWQGLADVEIAHVFSASYWSFLLAPAPAWFLGRLRSKKVLIHYHSGEARDHLRRFRSGRFVLSRADGVVVPSGYLVDVFREFGLRATVVPNLVDLSQFRFRERNPLRPHLVCTRGFHPYYCVDVVVKAFAKVQREFPDACLDLVGKGPSENNVRRLVGLLQLRNVNFCGVASRTEIGRYYEQADIFINASRLDNMPVSIIEAFASGTPVVSTSPEAMPYLIDHGGTGLLSAVGDENALADNVARLLREPYLANKLAQHAYEQSQKYAWSAIREQWIQEYRTLLQQERQR
jgi:glycosyltransferase involved in cell wall biosynthesis